MKKTLSLASLIICVAVFSHAAWAHTAEFPYTTELYAGGGNAKGRILVGEVRTWNDGSNLYVKYMVTNSDWCLTLTHLHVATSMEAIPQKNGNPIPGKFDLKMPHECVSEYTYVIPMSFPVGTQLYIAAHAEVCPTTGATSDIESFIETLPEAVSVNFTQPSPDFRSYFRTTIAGGSILDGIHEGWCADLDRGIPDPFIWFVANVYSIFEELPPDVANYPENFDLVNWIIQQDFVGKPSPSGGMYTYGDVQRVIWELLEGDWTNFGCTPIPNAIRAAEIMAAALANGEGFVPACNEKMVLVLIPVNEFQEIVAQITLIAIPVPCIPTGGCETAWAWGLDFPGKNWATYFTYTIQ
jgi:hypothetical protein